MVDRISRPIVVIAAIVSLVLAFLATPPGTLAVAEVRVQVAQYRTWKVGLTVHVAGEIRNTSTSRINGYVIVGVSPGRNGPSETLYDLVMVSNLAPGQTAPFHLTSNYISDPGTVRVTSATAGGYVVTGAPDAAVGIDAGPVYFDGIESDASLVTIRNGNADAVFVDGVSATFYGTDGKVRGAGRWQGSVPLEVAPGASADVWVYSGATGSSYARPGAFGHLGGGPGGGVVAWTNWFHDVGAAHFSRDIAWIAERGITSGCAAFRYCPTGTVSRAQMASFLAKALALPAATKDYFIDDEGSAHERLQPHQVLPGRSRDARPDGRVPPPRL